MNFEIECVLSTNAEADKAKEVIHATMLDMCLNDTNYHVGSHLGGNSKQFMILSHMRHVLTNKQQGVFFDNDICYWNVTSIANGNVNDVRRYINAAFDQSIPSVNVAAALLLNNLLDEGPESKFIDSYEKAPGDMPEVSFILRGQQFNINKLTSTGLFVATCVATGTIARKLDALQDVNFPELDNTGSFLLCVPMDVALLAIRRMIGIQRIVRHALDERWSNVLNNIASAFKYQ